MNLLIQYALSFVHQPYKWGGDDPSGYDCSGLVQDILNSVNLDPPGDQTAQQLYEHFVKPENGTKKTVPVRGALVFFGERSRIIHVGFALNSNRMVDAAGGGRHVQTEQDAIKYNAFVRVSWIGRRADFLAALLPRYEEKGIYDFVYILCVGFSGLFACNAHYWVCWS